MDSLIQESEWGQRSNMLEDKDFELLEEESPVTEGEFVIDTDISDDDFTLAQVDESVHEQKFQTKPTTFLKDSLKRFRKNKSSVVAAYILGGLLLLSFIVPIVDTSDIRNPHPEETYLAPKLFKSGTGFWDGTITYKNIAVDISEMPDAQTDEEKAEHWWPSSEHFEQRSAISNKKISQMKYVNNVTDSSSKGTYGKDGYIQFGYEHKEDGEVNLTSKPIAALNLNEDLYLSVFDVYSLDKVAAREGESFSEPYGYKLGKSALYFNYQVKVGEEYEDREVQLVDYALAHNIGSELTSYAEEKKNISDIIKAETGADTFENASFSVRMVAEEDHKTCCLIGGIAFETASTSEAVQQTFADISFTDATYSYSRKSTDGYKFWTSTGVKQIYLSKTYYCSFTYDTYEAKFGTRINYNFSIMDLLDYVDKGWISFENKEAFDPITLKLANNEIDFVLDTIYFKCTILDPVNCPLAEPIVVDDFFYTVTPDSEGIVTGQLSVAAKVVNYKVLGYDKMPQYLLGTDKSGRDMLKYVFEGLRTSLLLGIITFAVCFTFGLFWGSVSGYFGGTVDLVMERITDILWNIPGIVVLTLIIIRLGSNLFTFAVALCMTGWLGTAARTRTQFYRFKGREYVLASRTLGASDARLIVKHILPNAMGTIITGAVLMIPSVIFSEATISYLGLGLKNLSSLGVVLSDNQSELLTNSHLLIFPAIIIALIMISFNLFGNGLRDAINPSLKGEE